MGELGLWSEAKQQQLRALYSDHTLPISEIAMQLGFSSKAIGNQARSLGLRRRHKNADINQRYFHDIATTEQAYLLGLLAADGSVSSTPGRYDICLALKRSDEELIVRFQQAVAPQAVMSYDRHLVRVRVGCKQMVVDLAEYNVIPRKSYNFTWPQKLLHELASPFLLGYFDGDGCLSRHANGRLQWTLLGCEAFLWEAREHIARLSGVNVSFPAQSDKRIKHVYRIDAMSEKAIAIDGVLNASRLGLARKHIPIALKNLPSDAESAQ
jgi:hypothetical protein